MKLKNFLFPFISLLPLTGMTQAPTAKLLPLDKAVRTGKLPNGFTYYIRHNEEPKNRVELYLVNKAGSILEDEDQRGLAHFMEHMSFNGTRHFPKNALVDYLQKSGIRFGADLNAYTSFDETVYQLPLPSDKPDILKNGLLIMHDWAAFATLDPAEIEKERGVVLEEKRLGKGAGERMQRQYWPVILNNSRYAERLPIGMDKVLNGFKKPAIARFYQDWYRPDLQALIVVGDIDVNAMEQKIRSQFADLKNPAKEKARTKYTVPLNGNNHFIAVTDKEMTRTEMEVLIKHPGFVLKTVADYRRMILQNLFNQLLAGRLAELSRQANPPFVEASAGAGPFMGGADVFDASVVAKPGELENGFKALWRETERVKRFGFTATELDRAKQSYLNRMESAWKEKDKTPSVAYVKEYQEHFLKGTAAPGITAEYELVKKDLPGITLSDVNRLAKVYIVANNRDILIQAPEKDKNVLPNEATVLSWIDAVTKEELQPYQDMVSSEQLLTQQPVPGKIVQEQYDAHLGITTLILSNGLKVVLKPTTFKNNEIRFTAFAPGGTSLAEDADYQSAATAAGILRSAGAGNYDAGQLAKYLEGKQLQVVPYIADRFAGVNGISTPKDLETALSLTYAYFTRPRKDTAIFAGILERSKAGLANRGDDPQAVFSDTVSAVLGNHNIRRTGPSLGKLRQVDLDKAAAFYRARFADASGFTFVFTGSIDTVAIRPLLEKYLGSLPAIYSHEQARNLGIHIPEGRIARAVYKGSEPKSSVILVYSGKFDYSQADKIKLDAVREALEIRLLERLREEESGVYSPGVSVSTGKYPESRFSLVIQFGCAPQNVEKLIASATDEVNKLKVLGPPQENVDKWRKEDANTMETELKTNGFWLGYLAEQLQNEEEPGQVDTYAGIRDSVSVHDVKATAAKYLTGDNFIRLVLLPENKE